MGDVLDAGAIFLGADLTIEVVHHLLELADDGLQIGYSATGLGCLEAPHAQDTFAWLHCSIPPTHSNW